MEEKKGKPSLELKSLGQNTCLHYYIVF